MELDLKCAQTSAQPAQAFELLRSLAGSEELADIDPAGMQLLHADDPSKASALVTVPKGALGQVASLAESYERRMGNPEMQGPAHAGITQAHVMGFENVPAEMRPTLLGEIAQACANEGIDPGALAMSTRDGGLLAGNVTIACRSTEEFAKAERAVAGVAPKWSRLAGTLSCAEGLTPADELPLSADELSDQAEALAARLIDSGFPSPVITLSRRNGPDGEATPESFSMSISMDEKAAARAGFTKDDVDEAVSKWRAGEKAKIAKSGTPAAGSFAEKKLRALAGAEIVTRDPARMSPQGRNLVSENAAAIAASKAKRAAGGLAKGAI